MLVQDPPAQTVDSVHAEAEAPRRPTPRHRARRLFCCIAAALAWVVAEWVLGVAAMSLVSAGVFAGACVGYLLVEPRSGHGR